jgi:hypothetical protein
LVAKDCINYIIPLEIACIICGTNLVSFGSPLIELQRGLVGWNHKKGACSPRIHPQPAHLWLLAFILCRAHSGQWRTQQIFIVV